MGYYLLDNKNPHGSHFYKTRKAKVLAGVVHTGENLPDYEPPDTAGESLARYAATTSRSVSWHDTSDSDSRIDMLPHSYTCFHVRGYNSRTLGLEQGTQAAKWGAASEEWVDGILEQTARVLASWAEEFDLPVRRIGKAALDAGQKGFIGHADLDPGRRSDPGRDFPWDRVLDITSGLLGAPVEEPPEVDTTQPVQQDRSVLQFGDRGDKVREWQQSLLRWNGRALPQFGADGGFGGETRFWTRTFQKAAGITVDGIVGPNTRKAMSAALTKAPSVGEPAKPVRTGIGDYRGKLLKLQRPLLRHQDVRDWQKGINRWRKGALKEDAVYGPITRSWTETFQRAAGLRIDGIVGPKTWSALDRVLKG